MKLSIKVPSTSKKVRQQLTSVSVCQACEEPTLAEAEAEPHTKCKRCLTLGTSESSKQMKSHGVIFGSIIFVWGWD